MDKIIFGVKSRIRDSGSSLKFIFGANFDTKLLSPVIKTLAVFTILRIL